MAGPKCDDVPVQDQVLWHCPCSDKAACGQEEAEVLALLEKVSREGACTQFDGQVHALLPPVTVTALDRRVSRDLMYACPSLSSHAEAVRSIHKLHCTAA